MIRALAPLLLLLPTPSLAQDSPPTVEETEAVARQMADSQAASAIAQQQFVAMQPGAIGPNFRGSVAHPGGQPGVWQVALISATGNAADAPLVALASYEIVGGAIRGETIYPVGDAPYLEGDALFMARAKREAPRAVVAQGGASFCLADGDDPAAGLVNYRFSTIVLPPREDGSFDAYVLNGPIEPGAFPLGKHFRVPFDQFGVAGAPELLSDTCEVVTWDEADPARADRAFVTEYDDGEAPNAIHVFVSSQVPMPLGVLIAGRLWTIVDGEIGDPVAVR